MSLLDRALVVAASVADMTHKAPKKGANVLMWVCSMLDPEGLE